MKNYYKNKRFKDKIILADLSCFYLVFCFVFFKKGGGGGGGGKTIEKGLM